MLNRSQKWSRWLLGLGMVCLPLGVVVSIPTDAEASDPFYCNYDRDLLCCNCEWGPSGIYCQAGAIIGYKVCDSLGDICAGECSI